jgi:pimeloyl-ACP methyl ester carboxylesterase
MYHFFKDKDYTLAFQIFGHGEKKMIAFHGFGQESSVYQELSLVFPHYTIYSIDLFFHGQSEWYGDLDSLDFAKWGNIMQEFITHYQVDNFDIIGFSMGGRMALATISIFFKNINHLFLLAPDGIQLNPWYKIATKISPLQKIFKYVTHSETDIYSKTIGHLDKYGLIHKHILKLAEVEMNTPQKRKRVYHTWMLYRFLEINLNDFAEMVNQRKIKTSFFVGKYDKLINIHAIKPLYHQLQKSHIEILDCGHHRLIHHFAKWVKTNSSYFEANA